MIFTKKVDKRNKQVMIDFLSNHSRYWTMNSWNRLHSYSNNIKAHNHFSGSDLDKAYEIMGTDYWDEISYPIEEFIDEYPHYRIYSNGRSSGYLVLMRNNSNVGVDQDEDFEDYSIESLRASVELVTDFDLVCDRVMAAFKYLVDNYNVVEETITILKQVKVLRQNSEMEIDEVLSNLKGTVDWR